MPRCSELHHIFKLTHVQIVVEAFLRKQLRCIALLDDAAVVDDKDPVGLLDRGKAVCNDKGGTSLSKLFNALLHEDFRVGIDAAGCLVQNQDAGIGYHRAGKGEQLLLTDGKTAAAFG